MPSYIEDSLIDTSSIEYPQTGIRLLSFVITVYGRDVLEKLKKGKLMLFFNENSVTFDKNFRNRRVKEDTNVHVIDEEKRFENDMSIFA
jgi:hypothetical protein